TAFRYIILRPIIRWFYLCISPKQCIKPRLGRTTRLRNVGVKGISIWPEELAKIRVLLDDRRVGTVLCTFCMVEVSVMLTHTTTAQHLKTAGTVSMSTNWERHISQRFAAIPAVQKV
ncbi:MAG: hypothetical protein P8J22_12635, partial [Pseudomonadales bacterium]|nr:hypothetical protein [Pseudomonadales bacterium]